MTAMGDEAMGSWTRHATPCLLTIGFVAALASTLGDTSLEAQQRPKGEATDGIREAPTYRPQEIYLPRFFGVLHADEAKSKAREAAVARGLRWLAAHQSRDGLWRADEFATICDGKQSSNDALTADERYGHEVGITGLIVRAFLASGYTQLGTHAYADTLKRALDALLQQQDNDGCFGSRKIHAFGYVHWCASMAVADAYGMTGDRRLFKASNRANEFTMIMRNPFFGWRYGVKPGDNDTMCTAFAALAMESWMTARRAQCDFPSELEGERYRKATDGCMQWVEKITDPYSGRAGYDERGSASSRLEEVSEVEFDPAEVECLTAAACWLRDLALRTRHPDYRYWHDNSSVNTPMTEKGMSLIKRRLPKSIESGADYIFWLFGSMAVHHFATPRQHTEWVNAIDKTLIGLQNLEQPSSGDVDWCGTHGSWAPTGAWGMPLGRLGTTAVALLTLQVPAWLPRSAGRFDRPDGDRLREIAEKQSGGNSDRYLRTLLGRGMGVVDSLERAARARAKNPSKLSPKELLRPLSSARLRRLTDDALLGTTVRELLSKRSPRPIVVWPKSGSAKVRVKDALKIDVTHPAAEIGVLTFVHDGTWEMEADVKTSGVGKTIEFKLLGFDSTWTLTERAEGVEGENADHVVQLTLEPNGRASTLMLREDLGSSGKIKSRETELPVRNACAGPLFAVDIDAAGALADVRILNDLTDCVKLDKSIRTRRRRNWLQPALFDTASLVSRIIAPLRLEGYASNDASVGWHTSSTARAVGMTLDFEARRSDAPSGLTTFEMVSNADVSDHGPWIARMLYGLARPRRFSWNSKSPSPRTFKFDPSLMPRAGGRCQVQVDPTSRRLNKMIFDIDYRIAASSLTTMRVGGKTKKVHVHTAFTQSTSASWDWQSADAAK